MSTYIKEMYFLVELEYNKNFVTTSGPLVRASFIETNL